MTASNENQQAVSLERSALLARLPGVTLLDLQVESSTALTPALRRITLSSEALVGFEYQPGQDLMISIPDDGGAGGNGSGAGGNGASGRGSSSDRGPAETGVDASPELSAFRRRYTIRRLDRTASTLDVEVVVHGDGPGARWAARAQPGDHIEAIGPRGKVTLDPEAGWHLWIADESGLPNAFAMAEALDPGSRALLILEVDGIDDQLEPPSPAGVTLDCRWVHRNGGEPGSAEALAGTLATVTLPAGPGHAYLTGELSVVAGLRSSLVERGMARSQLSAKPYWRRGVANAPHGEPLRDPEGEPDDGAPTRA